MFEPAVFHSRPRVTVHRFSIRERVAMLPRVARYEAECNFAGRVGIGRGLTRATAVELAWRHWRRAQLHQDFPTP